MTIAWVDNTGKIIRLSSDDGEAPGPGLTPITPAPEHGSQVWNFGTDTWGPKPPPPPDPDDELGAALAEVQSGLSGVSTVAGVAAALNNLIDVMLGQTGKAGRVAGRPL